MGAIRKHVLVGVAAALLLIAFYLGILTLAQGLDHARDQTLKLWYWVLVLAGGFGIQAGLFSFIWQSFRKRRLAATASAGASGVVSAGSMVACCAHHLSDLLPFLGLSGLAAFLVNYQTVFIIGGVLSNIVGITIMLDTIQRHRLCAWVTRWRWNMGQVKIGTMISSVFILIATVFLVY